METTTVDILNQKHEAINNEDSSVFNKLQNEVNFLTHFIKKFFSDNGDAEGIRNMYKGIEENPDKQITCFDAYEASKIYKEYIDGMKSFITDINNLDDDGGNFSDYQDKFGKAKENDGKFIDALFNGQVNAKKTVSLQEAVINLEELIDLIPYMEMIVKRCDDTSSKLFTSANQEKTNLQTECVHLMCNSVRHYCYSMVLNIIETYIAICNALKAEEAPVEKKFVLY